MSFTIYSIADDEKIAVYVVDNLLSGVAEYRAGETVAPDCSHDDGKRVELLCLLADDILGDAVEDMDMVLRNRMLLHELIDKELV